MKIIFSIVFLLFSQLSVADVIEDAKLLLKQNNAAAAYQLLAPLEVERSEESEFNYLLGISALDSQQFGKAVFALERAVALSPQNPQYRADLGRVYFELGERHSAKSEFDLVLTANPPEQAKINIERYLSAIANLDNLSKTRLHAFIDYTVGFDSNINSATSSTSVAAPGLGLIFNLDSQAVKLSDKFHLLTAGVDFAKPISSSFTVIGGAKVSQRINWDESQFNLTNLDLNLGFAKSYKNDLWSLNLINNELTLDSKRFRRAYGVNGQWQHNLSDFSQLSLYGQLNRIAFPNQETRDANRAVLGAGYARVFDAKLKPLIYFGIFSGEENTVDNSFDFLGFDLFGLRLGGQISVNPRLDLSISSSFENRYHHERDSAFLITRHDKQYDLNIGARYLLLPTLTLTSNLGHTKNITNYDISDFERTILTFSIRKDFNW